MAASRLFNGASTSYLESATVPTALNAEKGVKTVFAWFKPSSLQAGTIVGLGKSTGSGYLALGMNTTGTVFAERGAGTDSTTTGKFTAGTWSTAAMTVDASNKLWGWIGGVKAGSSVEAGANTAINRIHIGALDIAGSITSWQKGEIAHVAGWSVELSEANMKLLAEGHNPFNIEKEKLVLYYPLTTIESPQKSFKGEFGAALTVGASAGTGTTEPTVEAPSEGGTKANAAVPKVLWIGAAAAPTRKQTGAVSKVLSIGNASSPSRHQAGAVSKVLSIANVATTVRALTASVGRNVAFGNAASSARKQTAAVGRDVETGAAPASTLKLAAAAALIKVLGMAPTSSGRSSALAAAALARILGAAPTARRSQSPFAGKIVDSGGIPHGRRSQGAQVPLVAARGNVPASRRAAIAAAVMTHWRALDATHSMLAPIPDLILPLVALFTRTVNAAIFGKSANAATFSGDTNAASFEVPENVAIIEQDTNEAEIESADSNAATIGS